jgi:hypothetical protein
MLYYIILYYIILYYIVLYISPKITQDLEVAILEGQVLTKAFTRLPMEGVHSIVAFPKLTQRLRISGMVKFKSRSLEVLHLQPPISPLLFLLLRFLSLTQWISCFRGPICAHVLMPHTAPMHAVHTKS